MTAGSHLDGHARFRRKICRGKISGYIELMFKKIIYSLGLTGAEIIELVKTQAPESPGKPTFHSDAS